MEKPTIIISPHKSAVSSNSDQLDVLIRVQAPDLTANSNVQHTPKRLSIVVDRSGSMSGQPLDEALRCVTYIANHLTAKDQMSFVVYDDDVDTLVPLMPISSAKVIQDAVDGVRSGGSTNLFGGWERGAEELEGGSDRAISRVLLLSDGQANHGVTNILTIEEHCRRWLAKGISTTTVGLGRGFNEELMLAMAQAGGGQQYYGQTAEDLYDNFEEELSLLQSLYMRQINLKLIPAQGVIIEMLSVATQNADGTYKMNDLAFGSETWVAIRLHVSASVVGTLRDLLVASITGTHMDGTNITQASHMLQLPVVDEGILATMPADELVVRRLLEVEFGRDAIELRQIAKDGNRRAIVRKLEQMEERYGMHPWLKAKMVQLQRLAEEDTMMMMKEANFSGVRMSRRLVSKNEMLYSRDETDANMPSFLRKKDSEGTGRRKPR